MKRIQLNLDMDKTIENSNINFEVLSKAISIGVQMAQDDPESNGLTSIDELLATIKYYYNQEQRVD